MAKTKTAGILRCGFNQLNRIMQLGAESYADLWKGFTILISIDEKALNRGHTYATIVSDSDRGVVGERTDEKRCHRPIRVHFRANQGSGGIYGYVKILHWSS